MLRLPAIRQVFVFGTTDVASISASGLTITAPQSATSGQLSLSPPNGLAQQSEIRFRGTFHDGTTDIASRYIASIRSGFSVGAWGNEFLDIWLNNQPNDANSDANQSQILHLTPGGITIPVPLTVNSNVTTGQLSAGGIIYSGSNVNAVTGTWGSALANNITQGQGEMDFVSLYYPYGGFRWYQVQTSGGPLVSTMQLDPAGNLRLYGAVGVSYNGIPGGGNGFGFAWVSNAPQLWVDGTNQGLLAFQSWVINNYLPLVGGKTVTGDVTFSGVNPAITVDGPRATWRTVAFTTSGSFRWHWQASADDETGSNVGSDLGLTRFTDGGAVIDQPLKITRSTGLVTLANNLTVNGAAVTIPNGGLNFGNRTGNGALDLSQHITLWQPGYGFSITGGTLNIVAGGTIALYANGAGAGNVQIGGSSTVTLAQDPTAPLHAATRQYVDNSVAAATGGGAVTAPSAGVTLTAASARAQSIAFTAAYLSVTLPNATTMLRGGPLFSIYNAGGFTFAVLRSDGSLVTAVPSNATADIYLDNNSTAAGAWHASGYGLLPAFETKSALMTGVCNTISQTALVGFIGTTAIYNDNQPHFVGYDTVGNTFTNTLTLAQFNTLNVTRVMPISATQGLLLYGNGTLSGVVLTVSGATLSAGTEATLAGYAIRQVVTLVAGSKWLVAYDNGPGSGTGGNVVVVSVSGTTVTWGTPVTGPGYYVWATVPGGLLALSATSAVGFDAQSQAAYAMTISGTTIMIGAAASPGVVLGYAIALSATTVVFGGSIINVATVAGNVITMGTSIAAPGLYTSKIFALNATTCVAFGTSGSSQPVACYFTVSGGNATLGSATPFAAGFQYGTSAGQSVMVTAQAQQIAPGYFYIPQHGVITFVGSVCTLVQPDPWMDYLMPDGANYTTNYVDGSGCLIQFLIPGSNNMARMATARAANNVLGKTGTVTLFGGFADTTSFVAARPANDDEAPPEITLFNRSQAISPGQFLVTTQVPGRMAAGSGGSTSYRASVWQIAS